MEIIESEDLGRRIGKKLINGNKVEIGIGNILEKMVEEKLIEKMIRREKEKNLEDKVVNERISMVVIEENLKIEEKRRKENKEIRIKMKFKIEESEGKSGLIKVLIIKGDGKRIGVKIFNRKIKKQKGIGRNRKEGDVGRLELLEKSRKNKINDVVIELKGIEKKSIENEGEVILCRNGEIVIEEESVEEEEKNRIIVLGKDIVIEKERVRKRGKRNLKIGLERGNVRKIVGKIEN